MESIESVFCKLFSQDDHARLSSFTALFWFMKIFILVAVIASFRVADMMEDLTPPARRADYAEEHPEDPGPPRRNYPRRPRRIHYLIPKDQRQ
ncbi:hypothetical protein L5515_017680 [Caenorhabditis briggsae]|uniref:Uncharacterized protein n=1 Tax=Caenorhabditis briggsae TaxID=6238 RepID=A0AAE9FED1_CAEBR|nr:hypothetical protein L5515_017680 [Caenorhabditis briggsae]